MPAPRIGFAPAQGAGPFAFVAFRRRVPGLCLAALPVVIYIWKVVVYDGVLALGTTDPITGEVATWAGVIVTTYFGGRTNSGTVSGNCVLDHQLPTAVNHLRDRSAFTRNALRAVAIEVCGSSAIAKE